MNVWCDNKLAINIANKLVQHDRTKHVEIDRFFMKEKLDAGIIKMSIWVQGNKLQIAWLKDWELESAV